MATSAKVPGPGHHGELSMESFIRTQMSVILQPFADHVQQLDSWLHQLKERLDQTDAGVGQLRSDLGDTNRNLADTKGALQRTDAGVSTLRENFDRCSTKVDQMHRDQERMNGYLAQVGSQVDRVEGQAQTLEKKTIELMQGLRSEAQKVAANGNQIGKHQQALEALLKQSAAQQHKQEQQDAHLNQLQSAQNAADGRQESLTQAHAKLAHEVDVQGQGQNALKERVDATRNGLSTLNAFCNDLKNTLSKTVSDLSDTNQRLDGLKGKHDVLCNNFEKCHATVAEISHAQRQATADIQALQREVGKTNSAVSRNQAGLEATNHRVGDMSNELDRAMEALHHLDKSVECCHAGFSGLQKGFVGPLTLPKLALSKDHDRPR